MKSYDREDLRFAGLAFASVTVRFAVAGLPFVFCFSAAGFTVTALRTGAAFFVERACAFFVAVVFSDTGCGESTEVR